MEIRYSGTSGYDCFADQYFGLRTESRRSICFEIRRKVRNTNKIKHKIKKLHNARKLKC